MTDTKDYRWFAADTVMRKSMSALQALQHQQNLIRMSPQSSAEQSTDSPPEDALLAETQRAMDMAREALADISNQEQ